MKYVLEQAEYDALTAPKPRPDLDSAFLKFTKDLLGGGENFMTWNSEKPMIENERICFRNDHLNHCIQELRKDLEP